MVSSPEKMITSPIPGAGATKRAKTSPAPAILRASIHVEVKLAKGVAKSVVEKRLPELKSLLAQRTERNWRTFELQGKEGETVGDEKPLSSLISFVLLGSLTHGDAAPIQLQGEADDCQFHLYRPNADGPLAQELSVDANADDSTVGSSLWQLPCVEFESIWENLIYESELKNEIMSYVYALVRLSERGANMNIINVNRLVLLLGPPGTGKTSLCKGVAQHVSIRMARRFPRSCMVEINSHSLFSKWFSESGKLVLKMFDQIAELADDDKCLVFVLIDEVESLGMARSAANARGDPADSIRAVNALLTQIDRIRRRENVLVLCTSNLAGQLDSALLDRADLVRDVGPPGTAALYTIMRDCVLEMQRIGIVSAAPSPLPFSLHSSFDPVSYSLLSVAESARGLSGRAIRQIPALAYSKMPEETLSVDECISLLRAAVDEKKTVRGDAV